MILTLPKSTELAVIIRHFMSNIFTQYHHQRPSEFTISSYSLSGFFKKKQTKLTNQRVDSNLKKLGFRHPTWTFRQRSVERLVFLKNGTSKRE